MFNIDTLLPLIETYIIQFTHINTATVHSFIGTVAAPKTIVTTSSSEIVQKIEQLCLLMALGVAGIQSIRLLFTLTILYTILYAYNNSIRRYITT